MRTMACLDNLDAIRTTNDTDKRKSTPLFCNGIERLQFNDEKKNIIETNE